MALTQKGNFKIYKDNAGSISTYVGEFTPKSLNVSFESLASSESGRNDAGGMVIEFLKHKVRKIEIEMPPYTYTSSGTSGSNYMSTLLKEVQGQIYWIEYWDNLDNNTKQIRVYTSNSSSDFYSGVKYQGTWSGLSFNAIQMANGVEN